ncbi:MAG TPA: NAD-dependent epimerase/dehydratase family protein, partial [Candidatus Omnitrophota bacterium]|nr:NAD-dependent epimerase/dehydratase family protein [Candidatus Omnitrophota bacterium]
MIVLTGGAGFIGSCILSKLNERGREDILVVDHRAEGDGKGRNLAGKKYIQFLDKENFLHMIMNDRLHDPVEAVIHMGACSSTTLSD